MPAKEARARVPVAYRYGTRVPFDALQEVAPVRMDRSEARAQPALTITAGRRVGVFGVDGRRFAWKHDSIALCTPAFRTARATPTCVCFRVHNRDG